MAQHSDHTKYLNVGIGYVYMQTQTRLLCKVPVFNLKEKRSLRFTLKLH